MAGQIIKQPNGKFLIFSSIVDSVTFYDMTEEEIVQERLKEAETKIRDEVKRVVDQLNKGEKPYYQFTKTYSQMLNWIKEVHGKKISDDIKKQIESKS
jgi:Asp-tRNA(Asn)/Glu-tRNA(Gln) amidotransferase B subunit